MSALSIQPVFPIFTDIDGQPLEDGYLWIGQANLDPQTNPISVFFDAALTIPAAQPIRTLSGYPANAGTPARLYVNSDYSIRVMNKNGTLVYSAASGASDRFSSAQISFIQAGIGAVTRTAQNKMREIVSVKDFGAVGDGVTDDTVAIQNAVDYVNSAGGGDVYVPDGIYMIDTSGITTGIQLKSNTALRLTHNAILRGIPTSFAQYRIINIVGRSNVGIFGGVIQGERALHTGIGGEQGHGIYIQDTTNVTISNLTSKDCWGDGLIVSSGAKDIFVSTCTFDNNRRNNISIVGGDNITVRDCVVKNANGTAPEDGIDIEPNPNFEIRNVLIQGCYVYGNNNDGIAVNVNDPLSPYVIDNIKIVNNTVYDNNDTGIKPSYANKANISGNVVYGNNVGIINDATVADLIISENTIYDNTTGPGIRCFSPNSKIIGNTIINSDADGIFIGFANGCLIQNNTIQNSGVNGINVFSSNRCIASGNVISTTQRNGILIHGNISASNNVINGNTILGASQETDDTYYGIFCDGSNVQQTIISSNNIQRSGANSPSRAIFATALETNLIANQVSTGAKLGNLPVQIAGNDTFANQITTASRFEGRNQIRELISQNHVLIDELGNARSGRAFVSSALGLVPGDAVKTLTITFDGALGVSNIMLVMIKARFNGLFGSWDATGVIEIVSQYRVTADRSSVAISDVTSYSTGSIATSVSRTGDSTSTTVITAEYTMNGGTSNTSQLAVDSEVIVFCPSAADFKLFTLSWA
jgi:parallel beta-helix repeat protein